MRRPNSRFKMLLVQLVMGTPFFASGLVAGLLWSAWSDQHPIQPAEGSPALLPVEAPGPEVSPIETAKQVRERVADSVFQLESRQEDLQAVARETRIAYQLLAERPGVADREACSQLLTRQTQIEQQLADLRAELEKAREIHRRMTHLLSDLSHAESGAEIDDPCLRDARELLWKNDPARSGPNAVIPDDRWARQDPEEPMARVSHQP